MARVTNEDCKKYVKNKFEMVLIAAQRVRDIVDGASFDPELRADKNIVIALRELANNSLDIDALRNHVIDGFREKSNFCYTETSEFEDDNFDEDDGYDPYIELKNLENADKSHSKDIDTEEDCALEDSSKD